MRSIVRSEFFRIWDEKRSLEKQFEKTKEDLKANDLALCKLMHRPENSDIKFNEVIDFLHSLEPLEATDD